MKKLLYLIAIICFAAGAVNAQSKGQRPYIYNATPFDFDSIRVWSKFRIPRDTLVGADSGSFAIKNGITYVKWGNWQPVSGSGSTGTAYTLAAYNASGNLGSGLSGVGAGGLYYKSNWLQVDSGKVKVTMPTSLATSDTAFVIRTAGKPPTLYMLPTENGAANGGQFVIDHYPCGLCPEVGFRFRGDDLGFVRNEIVNMYAGTASGAGVGMDIVMNAWGQHFQLFSGGGANFFAPNGSVIRSTKYLRLHGDSTAAGVQISVGGLGAPGTNEIARFTSTGLGVGTTSPQKKFHVNGTVRLEGMGTASNDTTTYKPLGLDASGNAIKMTFWPGSGGGGATPGINDVLSVNQSFTAGQTIDMGGNLFDISGSNNELKFDNANSFSLLSSASDVRLQAPNVKIMTDPTKIWDTTGNKLLVRNASTGKVYTTHWPTFGSGGGGATTALDNLSAVAINTSLLPATDNAIDLGSASKQWRDLYLTGASVYLDGAKTLSAAGLDLPSGGAIRTRTTAGNTTLLQAYNTGGASYTTFGTLTAGTTPTFDLSTSTTLGGATIQTTTGSGTGLTGVLKTANNLSDVASAATSRTNLGATTLGGNLFTLTNPSAVTFPRFNADNTVTAQTAANFKTDLSLNNVENTALSTWAGSTNVTTVGTVGTGTWNATAIADGKIASALTGKTYNGITPTANAVGFQLAGGTTSKTFTVGNTLTLAGTDGSTLNVGAGGTLQSAAFSPTSAFEVPLTFSTGLTRSTNTITVNTSQNISTLSNLTTNGYVKTSGGTGALSVSTTIPTGDLPATLVYNNQSNTYTAGNKQIFAANTTSADIRLSGFTSDPSTLAAGDVWYNTTSNVFKGRFNTTTRQFATLDGTEALTNKDLTGAGNTFPTFNQNTTGSAATLNTSRNIYGNPFNGSADVTGVISSSFGGTGNGFFTVAGPATSAKTFTFPNASANVLTDAAVVTSAQGGTGVNNGGRTLTINTNSGTLTYTNASTTLTVANTGSVSGTNTGDQTITLTGDVTGSGTGSFAATVANNVITNAKLATVATQTLKGRNTAATGNVEDITASQALDWIGATQGTVLYRGATGWSALTPGTAGQILQTGGAGANPSWVTNSGGSGMGDPGANGIVARTALNTTTARTITGTTNRLTVTNGDGVSGNPTLDVVSTSAATASRIMERDANGNTGIENLFGTYTSTATAAGTTTLTVGSTLTQYFTGTTTQTVVLPDATTLVAGMQYQIVNLSTGNVTVNKNGGGLLKTLLPNSSVVATVTDISTSAGTWNSEYSLNFTADATTNVPSYTFGGSEVGIVNAPMYSVLTSDFTLSAASGVQTAFSSAQDVWTLSGSTGYEVEGHFHLTTGTTTTKTTALAFALGGGATVTLVNININAANVAANGTATASNLTNMSQVASTVATATSTTGGVDMYFKGVIYMNAGGTVTPQINFSANPGGTNLMKAGSYIKFTRIGSNTFTTSGAVN